MFLKIKHHTTNTIATKHYHIPPEENANHSQYRLPCILHLLLILHILRLAILVRLLRRLLLLLAGHDTLHKLRLSLKLPRRLLMLQRQRRDGLFRVVSPVLHKHVCEYREGNYEPLGVWRERNECTGQGEGGCGEYDGGREYDGGCDSD
jgi:hypothetical protein